MADIDKGLFGAPEGEIPLGNGELPTEVEIILTDDGGVEVDLSPELQVALAPFNVNIVDLIDDNDLVALSVELMEAVEADKNSRKEWADTFVEGLDVLGFRYEERTEPWENACGVYSTVLAEAVIRFQAEAMSETFPAQGPVKTKILGEEDKDTREAAERVRVDMNYELTEVMSEYRPEHERMLYNLGLAGSSFKKVYFDPSLRRQTALHIPAEDVLVPYGASNIESAERVTHVMRKTPNEVLKLQEVGFYTDITLKDPAPFHTDVEEKKVEEGGYTLNEDNRYTIYEIHADLVLPGFSDPCCGSAPVLDEAVEKEDTNAVDNLKQIARPYVVTIECGSGDVLAIRRNWEPNDEKMTKRQHFVHYVYIPGFGFYGLGLIHIIGGYARAGTSLIRQLVDAGTLSNLPGGLKTRGMRIKGDDVPVGPGDWKDVDVPSGVLKDNIMPMPYGEPSQTLLALLNQITEEGRRLGAISDMNISDMSANAPVGTTLALLERTLKPMAAVQARVHYAMKQEFKLLHAIIAEHAPPNYGYIPNRAEPRARREDYATIEVIPVSDPNSSTMAQRVVQYQAVQQLATTSPQIYDMPYLHRQTIEILGVPNADKIVPNTDEDVIPQDPISENMDVLVGKPVKAFIHQDHDAHMAAHQSFMQDPMIMQTIGQNPMAQQIMAALHAHITEHLAFTYRKQVEEKVGAPLPPPNEELPPEIEVELSRLVAQAGTQLTQSHQQQAAQQEAQKQAEDPLIQMQKGELEIKARDQMRKEKKDADDKELAEAELGLKAQGIQIDAAKEGVKLKEQRAETDKKIDADIAKTIINARNKAQPGAK